MTTQVIDLKEIERANPGVDSAKVSEALATVEAVDQHGIERANYSIQSPYSRTSGEPSRDSRLRSPVLRFSR